MNIQQLVDLVKEEFTEQSNEIIKAIVARHQAEREIENDEEVKKQVSLILDSEALKAIKILRTYEK